MKYDLSKKQTIGAERTLKSLRKALFTLLSEKAFEDIAVQELCEKAMLPRATFYNYFDDKYDLLDYCFLIIRREIISKETTDAAQDRLSQFMENCIDFIDRNAEEVTRILANNHLNQYFMNQFRFYLITNMIEEFKTCPDACASAAPQEMAARLCSEAVLIVLEWKYLQKKGCSKDQAKVYLQLLIGGIA